MASDVRPTILARASSPEIGPPIRFAWTGRSLRLPYAAFFNLWFVRNLAVLTSIESAGRKGATGMREKSELRRAVRAGILAILLTSTGAAFAQDASNTVTLTGWVSCAMCVLPNACKAKTRTECVSWWVREITDSWAPTTS